MLSARQPGQPVYSGLRSNVPASGSISGELDWPSEISVALVRYQASPENSNSEIIVMGEREHFMSTHVLRGRSGIWRPLIWYGEPLCPRRRKHCPPTHGRMAW